MPSSKQLIQDTAVRLFNERGYDKVSLRDIAREAGVAIGSLTYHFRRKEDLLDAILADLHGNFEEALDPALGGRELWLIWWTSSRPTRQTRSATPSTSPTSRRSPSAPRT